MHNRRYIPIDYGRAETSKIIENSLRCFTIPANQSTLGARLSLIRYAQSRRVGSRLIAFSAPINTLRAKTPSPSSLRARLSLIRYAQSRRVGFRSMLGFHPPSIIPYRNHAYEANRFLQSIKLYEKTCTKLLHQKCAGTPRLENCAGTPILTNCSKNV